MNRKYILTPNPIAEKCTLWEALHWVAFNYYPTADYTDNNLDSREDTEYLEELKQSPPHELEVFFTKDVCVKYGLVPCPIADYVLEHGEYPVAMSQELIDKLSELPDFSKDELRRLVDEREIQNEIDRQQNKFDAALVEFLEEPKAELFLALRKGKVRAFGRNLLEDYEVLEKSPAITIEEIWASGVEPELSEIYKNEWYSNAIQWQEGILHNGNKTAYCHILVDVESLFNHFPEPDLPTKTIHCINGIYIDSGNITTPTRNTSSKIGRPSFDWKSFQAEMASRLLAGNLPSLQKACVIEMGEWCVNRWGECPSETNLKNHISPFYEALKKSESKSEIF